MNPMQTLVVGIDGGDEDILSSMNLDFLSRFFNQHGTEDTKEDLWNRGWGSILSGEHGRTTGGFYEKPKLDGSHDFEQSFGTDDYENNDEIIPLWERLNNKGLKVGFMNVRTTMPAPEVNGFFVSGAGGGFKPSGGVPEEACYPSSVHELLSESDYIWETRFMDSGVKEISNYIDLINETVIQRADAFLQLCNKYDPDFGFIAQTETVGIQNLAMAELQPINENDQDEYNEIQISLQNFYQNVDDTIKNIVKELSPENIIVVSDHGAAPYKHSINPDAFLQRIGLQPTVGNTEQQSRAVIRKVGEMAPRQIVNLVSSIYPSLRDKATRPNTNWDKTKAFGHRYVPGIYINDERFFGPISDTQSDELIDEIITKFNNSDEAERYNLEASRYRSVHAQSKQYNLLPDIWIDKPETMFFEGGGDFIEKNDNYRTLANQNLEKADRNMFTGKKGSKPLLSYDFDYDLGDTTQPYDLTHAYDVILDSIQTQ